MGKSYWGKDGVSIAWFSICTTYPAKCDHPLFPVKCSLALCQMSCFNVVTMLRRVGTYSDCFVQFCAEQFLTSSFLISSAHFDSPWNHCTIMSSLRSQPPNTKLINVIWVLHIPQSKFTIIAQWALKCTGTIHWENLNKWSYTHGKLITSSDKTDLYVLIPFWNCSAYLSCSVLSVT